MAAPEAPAFFGPRWNGWTLFALAIVCILAFFVMQTVLFALIFFKDHPEILRYGYMPAHLQQELKDPAYITSILTAKNLWFISVLSEAVLALLTLGLARAAFKATASELGVGAAPKDDYWVLRGVLVGAGLLIASSVVENGIKAIYGPHPQPQALALLKHHGAVDFVLDFMSVSIAAPFAEELFFRGFIFAGLVQRMSPLLAMVISAAIFGGAHLEKWSFLPIFVIGVGLAWLYYQTRSLWVNIVAHSTVNTISLVLAYTFPQLVK